jgi:hypothetical protein
VNESVRDLLRQGADTVEKPRLDVGHLVAQAERRMFRRRLAAVAVSTVAVTMIAAGGIALRPDDRSSAPPPLAPVETPHKTSDRTSTGPSARAWVSDLKTDGSTLYVTTADCAGQVQDGYCTTRGVFADDDQLDRWGYWRGPGQGPLRLWRYAAGRWQGLTSPGVNYYEEFWAVPDGLVLKVWHDRSRPLPRVSNDGGTSWETWQPPRGRPSCRPGNGQHDQRECDVAVVGDAVIVTNGPLWMRRSLSGGSWQDVSPPSRELLWDGDDGGYGILTLDNGTLVATVNDPYAVTTAYRVSVDGGASWGKLRPGPGWAVVVDNAIGSVLYGRCADYEYGDPTTWRSDCGPYRTTDFEHWTMGGPDDVRLDYGGDLDGCPKGVPHGSRSYLSVVRIGGVSYGIAHLRLLDGSEVRNLAQLEIDDPDEQFRQHHVRHLVEMSTDRCRTWTPLP